MAHLEPIVPLRLLDADILDPIANTAEVRPRLGGTGQVALAEALKCGCVAVGHRKLGGFLFVPIGPVSWHMHNLVAPAGAGAWAQGAAKLALDYIFTALAAIEVWTQAEKGSRAYDVAAASGFAHLFEAPTGLLGEALTYWRTDWMGWACRSTAARKAGEDLQKAIHSTHTCGTQIPGDELHPQFSGAVLLAAQCAARAENAGTFLVERAIGAHNDCAALWGLTPFPTEQLGRAPLRLSRPPFEIAFDATGTWKLSETSPPCPQSLLDILLAATRAT